MLVRGDPSTISCPVSIHQGKKVLVGAQLLRCCFTSATLKGETDWRGASNTGRTSNVTSINKHRYMVFTRQIDSLTLAVTCSSSCSHTQYISYAACQWGIAVPAKTHVSGTVLPPLGRLRYCNAASLRPSISFWWTELLCSSVTQCVFVTEAAGLTTHPTWLQQGCCSGAKLLLF